MTDITTGHLAIWRRIVTMATSANFIEPRGADKPCPRYALQIAGGRQEPADMTSKTRSFPEVVVRCEVAASAFATDATALVQALTARFPVGIVFEGVKIDRAPEVRPALEAPGGVYAIPVVIRGTYVF